MSSKDAASPFRVIVVGAGVAGLTASHCLQKAGIDHIVLERREQIAPAEGASIALYPNAARILYQLGCLDAVKSACVPCDRSRSLLPGGQVIADVGFFARVREKYVRARIRGKGQELRTWNLIAYELLYLRHSLGEDVLLLERRVFLQILHDSLPSQSHISLGRAVKEIRHTVSGVEVETKDGDVETGHIVLGCDGVRSIVRSIMWDYANRITPGAIPSREKTKMKADWKCLVGVGGATPELGQRNMTAVHGTHQSFLALTQPNRVFWFFFFRLSEPVTWPRRCNYTAQDAERLAESVASHAVSDSLLFGELWQRRERGALVNIEEGLLDYWHFGRLVLAGDSVHKVTPNIALGGNSSIESVVTLCNHLQKIATAPSDPGPPLDTLKYAFEAYQNERHSRMRHIMEFSQTVTRLQAWDSRLHKLVARWCLPFLPARALPDYVSGLVRGAPKLRFLSVDGFARGRLPWKDEVGKMVSTRTH